jgi:YHS domain-containing protein
MLMRAFVSRRVEREAREHAATADAGHQHHSAGEQMSFRARLTSVAAWSDVAHNFRADWSMVWKEIALGFVLAGFIGLLGNDFFNGLFIEHAPAGLRLAENVVVGPIIAVLSFVCSIGNVPLAAVLWSGGISFAGVVAFLFADLIVIPIVLIYRKYYGGAFTARVVALMFVSIILAALAVDALFSGLGLIPHVRPARADIFSSVKLDYKFVLNVFATALFAVLFALTMRRGATDPVCGMRVDRAKALRRETPHGTVYFCSEHCRDAYEIGARDDAPRERMSAGFNARAKSL